MSTSSEPSRALPTLVFPLQHSVKNIQPDENTASTRETKNKWNQLKEGKAIKERGFPVIQAQPLIYLLSAWPRQEGLSPTKAMLQPQKNPETASESSRKDDRMSEVKTTLLIVSPNPINGQVGSAERVCK